MGIGKRTAEASTTVPERTDWSALMARAQGGDGAAYAQLLGEVTPYLRARAARWLSEPADIEDAVQDTLLTLHAVRRTYDPRRPFGPWLVAIARRRLIDRLRQRSRRTALAEALDDLQSIGAPPSAAAESAFEIRRMHRAIAALPAGQQRIIRLLKLGELSLKEAALQTGMSIGALKIATHRAMKALRVALTAEGER